MCENLKAAGTAEPLLSLRLVAFCGVSSDCEVFKSWRISVETVVNVAGRLVDQHAPSMLGRNLHLSNTSQMNFPLHELRGLHRPATKLRCKRRMSSVGS